MTNGRLGQYNKAGDAAAKQSTVPAYRVAITVPPEDPAKGDQPQVFTYDAVIITVDAATFLAYQPAADRKINGIFMDYLPVHRVARMERDADAIRFRFMKSQVVWLPTVKPLDAPTGDPKLPTEDGQYLVSDADRLVKVLSLALKSNDAWDEPVVVRLVRTTRRK